MNEKPKHMDRHNCGFDAPAISIIYLTDKWHLWHPDQDSDVIISFCPFCGEKLTQEIQTQQKPKWMECQMGFQEVEFSSLKPGQYVWHNVPGVNRDYVLGPLRVHSNIEVINSSDVIIPVSMFGPKMLWYIPILKQH